MPHLESRFGTQSTGELVDFRVRITDQTNQVLEAVARHDGSDKAEIARKVLADWAEHEIHRAHLIARLTRREGNGLGVAGKDRE